MTDSVSTRTTRRGVTKGALWALPAVAVSTAAPAYAISCSDTASFTVPMNNFPDVGKSDACQSTTSCSYNVNATSSTAGATAISVSTQATVTGSTTFQPPSNLVNQAYTGGLNQAVAIQQSSTSASADSYSTTTFTFGRPVTGLTFWISDIDSGSGWNDRVVVLTTPTAVPSIPTRDTDVTGNATTGTPLQNTKTIDNRLSGGRAQVTIPGTITSMSVRFWSNGGTAAQNIYVGDMTFTASAC